MIASVKGSREYFAIATGSCPRQSSSGVAAARQAPGRPEAPTAPCRRGYSADDIALGDARAAFGRLQDPSERSVDALHLQRAQRTAQTQSFARCRVDDLQMLNRAAILQPFAK